MLTRSVSGVQMDPEQFKNWWATHGPRLKKLLGHNQAHAQLENQVLTISVEVRSIWPFAKSRANRSISKWLAGSLKVTEDF